MGSGMVAIAAMEDDIKASTPVFNGLRIQAR